MKALLPALGLLLLLTACRSPAAAPPKPADAGAPVVLSLAPVSDVLKAPRPKGGEYLGLYLMGKKVGYLYSDLALVEGRTDQVRAVNEFVFKANVETKVSERQYKESRVYESRPRGRLLSFTVQQQGDGGNQVLEGTASAKGLRVLRRRPNQPDEVLNLPPSRELVEDADQVRVALLRSARVEGYVTDGQDLESYRVVTTVGESSTRPIGGVDVKVRKATTISDKEKVPTEVAVDERGHFIEINFGQTMRAISEPEDVAKRLDQVEVFGLTRVVLPKTPAADIREVPRTFVFVAQGLPERFWRNSYRQKFKKLDGGRVEVAITAATPTAGRRVRPVTDPNGGANLKSSIIVEADNPEIQATAKEILAGEKDAYLSALKIVDWVKENVQNDYGASADRSTDVLKQRKGDCTEHALLAVALLRAAGIPAKRIDGVVYLTNSDGVPAFYWHEWVEAYVGEWTQLDPTFGQHVADATHFALGEESNAEITPLIGALKVLEIR